MEIVVIALLVTIVACATFALLRRWRATAKLKATTRAGQAGHAGAVSLAGGIDVAGVSASVAAILGGPGVLTVHVGKRAVWRRSIPRLTVDALFEWLNARLSRPAPERGVLGRLVTHTKDALVARTDMSGLPELGVRVFLGLHDVSFEGAITCGFEDPAVTGKTAAWLFPIAGVLAPFGTLDVRFDWSGRNVFDGELDASFRIVPAKVALEGLRFARHHLHATTRAARLSSSSPHRIPASLTGDI